MDVEAVLVAELASLGQGLEAATEMPRDVEQFLPFVLLSLLPSEEWVKPWNAPGPDLYVVDVDVYAAADPADSGTAAVAVGQAVRSKLRDLQHAGLVTMRSPVLVPRPERNPRLNHRGAQFAFVARA